MGRQFAKDTHTKKIVSAAKYLLLFSYLWKWLLLAFKNVKPKHKQENEKPFQNALPFISLSKNQNSPSNRKKKKSHFKMLLGELRKREHFFLACSLCDDAITSETWQTLCSGGSHFKFLLQRDHFRAKQINRLKEVRKHAKPGRQGQVWCILRPQNGT